MGARRRRVARSRRPRGCPWPGPPSREGERGRGRAAARMDLRVQGREAVSVQALRSTARGPGSRGPAGVSAEPWLTPHGLSRVAAARVPGGYSAPMSQENVEIARRVDDAFLAGAPRGDFGAGFGTGAVSDEHELIAP